MESKKQKFNNDQSLALRNIEFTDDLICELDDEAVGTKRFIEVRDEALISDSEREQILRLLTFRFGNEPVAKEIIASREKEGLPYDKGKLEHAIELYRKTYRDEIDLIRNNFKGNLSKLYRFADSFNRVHLFNTLADVYLKELDGNEIGGKEFNTNVKTLMSLLREIRTESNMTKSDRGEDDIIRDVSPGVAVKYNKGLKRGRKSKKAQTMDDAICDAIEVKYGKDVLSAAVGKDFRDIVTEKVESDESQT